MMVPESAPSPLPNVVTATTYLLWLVPGVDSQPQEPANGRAVDVVDWTTSVMVVRQADAASTTSEILARLV